MSQSAAKPSAAFEAGPSRWTADQLRGLDEAALPAIPHIWPQHVVDILPGFQLWDCWPFETADGAVVQLDGGWTPWVIMAAPRDLHPDARHHVARLRLLVERKGTWRDCGFLLPDGLAPGSREWAGSTLYDPASRRVTLFFTAAGIRDEATVTMAQRLFQTSGTLAISDGLPAVTGWSAPLESVTADGTHYMVVDQADGQPGAIKGFRDPFHFRDPADGAHYLLFTASTPDRSASHNGLIGVARSTSDTLDSWMLLPPLLSANGLNNELERPMMRVVDGRYYLFWSTQRSVFAPDGPSGPTGIYGMVADGFSAPYRPLNGHGLVAPNPADEPKQCYSWWVTAELVAAGFVDHWGLAGGAVPTADDRDYISRFGGVPAPHFSITVDGNRAWVIR